MTDDDSNKQKLFFTSSKSRSLPLVHENHAYLEAFTGLYSCTLKDYGANDDDYEDDGGYCIDPEVVSDTYGSFYKDIPAEMDLPLFNVQFYVSPKNNEDSNRSNADADASNNDDGKNYLYGGSTDYHEEYPLYTWEILRADLPGSATTTNTNGLEFQPYFRTLREADWNNCNFDCCPFTDDVDSNGIYAHRDYHDNAFMHSYIRVAPTAFAVDHETGDVFIAWHGFYKNCNPANIFSVSKSLEWTVGISRLVTRTEDPTCILPRTEDGEFVGYSDLEDNFGRCTVPVAIVHQGSTGHGVLVPHGGFSVLPAVQEVKDPQLTDEKIADNNDTPARPHRGFLVTTLKAEKGATTSHVWAIAEGGDVTRNLYERQLVTSNTIDHIFLKMNVWNGGNQRLHYSQETGRPDHLCHTVFNKGIDCMPITVTEDKDILYLKTNGGPETILTESQVKSFCKPGKAYLSEVAENDSQDSHHREPQFEERSTLVTGLDVLWNEEDGTPDRIFFGCRGGDTIGRLGSVDRDGRNLREMLKGAYSGDVVLLPRKLDPITMAPMTPFGNSDAHSVTPYRTKLSSKIFTQQSFGISAAIFFVGCMISYAFFWKNMPTRYRTTSNSNYFENRQEHSNTYMELPMIGSPDASVSVDNQLT